MLLADPEGTERRFVVISQTCDVVLSKIPTVVFALVTTPPPDALPRARAGAMPRFIRLPSLGVDEFADMSFIETRIKDQLLGLPVIPGIDLDSPERQRDFSLAISRWFGRFPFPDEVVPWLKPVEEEIRKKYTKQGALGQVLNEDVVEIRVESDWRARPYALVLHLIIRAEALPTFEDLGPVADPSFLARLHATDGQVRSPSAVAEVLVSSGDPMERALAFEALAEAFAAICLPAERHSGNEAVRGAVQSIEGKLWSDDEFPLSQLRRSEPLDLEYLSESSGGEL